MLFGAYQTSAYTDLKVTFTSEGCSNDTTCRYQKVALSIKLLFGNRSSFGYSHI